MVVISVVRGGIEGRNAYGEDIRHAIAFARRQLVEAGPRLGKEARKSVCLVIVTRVFEIDVASFCVSAEIKNSQNKAQTYAPSKP